MRRKHRLIIWLVAGIVLALGPVWGLLGTVAGMIRAFGHLSAPAEPAVLANDIGFALWTTVAGWIACPIGIVAIVLSAIGLSRREPAPPAR